MKRGVSVKRRKADEIISALHDGKGMDGELGGQLPEMEARTRFSHASKKKNDSVLNILTSMMIEAAITARNDMILTTRTTLSTT